MRINHYWIGEIICEKMTFTFKETVGHDLLQRTFNISQYHNSCIYLYFNLGIYYLNYGKWTIIESYILNPSWGARGVSLTHTHRHTHTDARALAHTHSHTVVLLWLGWVRMKLQSLSEVTAAALQSGRIWLESSTHIHWKEQQTRALRGEPTIRKATGMGTLHTSRTNARLSLNSNCSRHTQRIHQHLVHNVSDIFMLLRKMHCIVHATDYVSSNRFIACKLACKFLAPMQGFRELNGNSGLLSFLMHATHFNPMLWQIMCAN